MSQPQTQLILVTLPRKSPSIGTRPQTASIAAVSAPARCCFQVTLAPHLSELNLATREALFLGGLSRLTGHGHDGYAGDSEPQACWESGDSTVGCPNSREVGNRSVNLFKTFPRHTEVHSRTSALRSVLMGCECPKPAALPVTLSLHAVTKALGRPGFHYS